MNVDFYASDPLPTLVHCSYCSLSMTLQLE